VPDTFIGQGRHHNRRHWRRSAHAKARELESNEDLVGTCRYVARNPVEAKLVRDPLAWPWDSTRAHAGLEAPRVPLAESELRAALGGRLHWREDYRMQIERA
jgi:hypothetical protein